MLAGRGAPEWPAPRRPPSLAPEALKGGAAPRSIPLDILINRDEAVVRPVKEVELILGDFGGDLRPADGGEKLVPGRGTFEPDFGYDIEAGMLLRRLFTMRAKLSGIQLQKVAPIFANRRQ